MKKDTAFKPASKMSLEEYLENFLPENHNDQDRKYLEARHRWEIEGGPDLYIKSSDEYNGTTFQARNMPEEKGQYKLF